MLRIGKKLHSRRGASILLALMFLLVATMVSSVVLSAALTAARRVDDDRNTEQEYLAVSSAAKYLTQALGRSGYVKTTYQLWDMDDNPLEAPAPTIKGAGLLSGVFAEAEPNWNDSTSGEYRIALYPSAVAGAQELPASAVLTFSLEKNDQDSYGSILRYDIVGGEISADGCGQKIYLSGRLQREESEAPLETVEVEGVELQSAETTVTWSACDLQLSTTR